MGSASVQVLASTAASRNKVTSDPLLWGPGTSLTNATGYELLTGSPAYASGVLISNNGGMDYFGNAVSSTAAPSRGAYNGPLIAGTPFQLVSVDDSVMGTGQNQITYTGTWGHCNPCSGDSAKPALYSNSNSWSNASGNTASITFSGTQIQLYVSKPRHCPFAWRCRN